MSGAGGLCLPMNAYMRRKNPLPCGRGFFVYSSRAGAVFSGYAQTSRPRRAGAACRACAGGGGSGTKPFVQMRSAADPRGSRPPRADGTRRGLVRYEPPAVKAKKEAPPQRRDASAMRCRTVRRTVVTLDCDASRRAAESASGRNDQSVAVVVALINHVDLARFAVLEHEEGVP